MLGRELFLHEKLKCVRNDKLLIRTFLRVRKVVISLKKKYQREREHGALKISRQKKKSVRWGQKGPVTLT